MCSIHNLGKTYLGVLIAQTQSFNDCTDAVLDEDDESPYFDKLCRIENYARYELRKMWGLEDESKAHL